MRLLTGRKGNPKISSRLLLFMIIGFFIGLSLFSYPQSSFSADEELYFTILHTNDEHGSVIPHSPTVDYHPLRENPTVGGYARLATAVNRIRSAKAAAGEPVMLISAGDYIGGSPYSWLIPEGYALELKIKQLIGYDAVVIGNHEYDYGPDILASYYIEAGYPAAHEETVVLASNTIAPDDHPLSAMGLYRESIITTLDNGLKVGMFGLIGKEAISYTTANEPVEFADQHETARRLVDEMKSQGADIIIAIAHSGVEEDREMALDIPGIDVIVGGHCHTALEEPVVENDTYIVQTGSLLQNLGQLELAYNPATGELRVRNEENNLPFLLPLDYSIPLDPVIDSLIEEYTELLSGLITVKTGGRFQHVLDTVMLSEFEIPNYPPFKESPFGNFVADAMRLVTEDKTGLKADFAIQANGAIRGSVTPGTMPHALGQVSVYDLAELVGLGIGPDGDAGYSVVAVYLTGEEIRRVLEVAALLPEMMGDTFFLQFSGLRYSYNPQNAILFTVPFLDLPIPTTRAVISAERYTGEGRQGFDDDLYTPIERGDQELYCLITDSYVVSFLPMVGEMLPSLDIVVKDIDGHPVEVNDLERLIVNVDGGDLKVWATVLEYAASQPVGSSGLPEADSYYAINSGRINPVWTIPLVIWPILILTAIVLLIVILVRRKKLKKKGLVKGINE
ncbi:MAG: bifunctional UDP-sugar hydrolase/5'-nucleotidase [Bacillota bacterium]|nr:bifunctional metallophosphatase/5'-nucleotidase [Bacillota bacterium]MDW7729966.1 bifunctional UDP-sugar hydrolase/5'-nucleotidase [Bacillota bacterium]